MLGYENNTKCPANGGNMHIRHSDILPLVKARAQNYPSDLLLEQELDHDSSNKSCQEKKRYQATRPPRRRAVFFRISLFLGGAPRQQGSTGEGPVEPCACPAGATSPSARGSERAAHWGYCLFSAAG